MRQDGGVMKNVPLAPLTSFRIGGPARWFAGPKTAEQARSAMHFAAREGLPLGVLGGGTNLLVADAGVDCLVLRLNAAGDFGRIEQDARDPLVWRAGAAAAFPKLVAETLGHGIGGLEEFSGIPGRIGGAIAMNAGSARSGLGDFVHSALVLGQDGTMRRMSAGELAFGYRSSALFGMLAIGFEFRFAARMPVSELMEKARLAREKKISSQPLDLPSAGCIFKNPSDDSAGRLLDAAGCKGMRVGGAMVSDCHANFIVNSGGATARDVALLAASMHGSVRDRFGVGLEPELRCWGFELRDYL